MSGTPDELTKTLILALSQSQDQAKTIREQAKVIKQLQNENRRLSEELHQARPERDETIVRDDSSSQVEDLFQKYVEAQAETHKLKKKLKRYKEKAGTLLTTPLSSPSTAPSTSLPSSPKGILALSGAPEVSYEECLASQSPPRKRTRLRNNVSLETPLNAAWRRSTSNSTSIKRVGRLNQTAMHDLDEDQREPLQANAGTENPGGVLERQGSFHNRLDTLLTAPSPSRNVMERSVPRTLSGVSSTPSSSLKRPLNISNIRHVTSNVPTSESTRKDDGLTKEPASESSSDVTSRRHNLPTTHAQQNSSTTKKPKGSLEDSDPLRKKPVASLSLQHFKPNPRWLDSHGVSYDEFLRGQNAKRMQVLVETLPKLPGQHEQGTSLTDEDLLREFLGPGSETKIASLTQVARANLLNEAKTKRMAQYFARQRADHDQEQNPPGFWSIDMAGTQEDETNREKAGAMEQAEVVKRYEDAVKGNGRWIFADE